MQNIKKILIFVSIAFLLLVGIQFVLAQTKPSGSPPSPWWSPAPSSAQSYISAICGSGDPVYQTWCTWLTAHNAQTSVSGA